MDTYKKALGLIETRGFIPAIEAADAMVKAANVTLVGKELTGGALVLITVRGEVGAVKAAVSAGREAAEKVGEFRWSHIIPRPDQQVDILIGDTPPEDVSDAKITETGDPEKMTVSQLRQIARGIPGFPLKGREVSTANKTLLLKTLKDYYKNNPA